MRNDPRGSVWRQWDFHFHTPASFDYKDNSVTNQQIVEGLIGAGVSAVVITDHHVMDVARIINLQRLGGDKLTVFPGIEFRSELGGKEGVHYIGIFPENSDVADTWMKLQVKLCITRKDVEREGDERIYVRFEQGADAIHELGGIVSVHAGKKSNSFENIGNTTDFKMAFKTDMMLEHIDLCEVGKAEDARGEVDPNLWTKKERSFATLPPDFLTDNVRLGLFGFARFDIAFPPGETEVGSAGEQPAKG